MAFLADAGMAFPSDPAGVVTVGVAPLADAGMVTIGVTDLADARAVSLADAGMAFPADPAADGLEYCGGGISCGDRVSPGVWCRERTQIQNDLDCQHVNYVSCDPVGMGCTVQADGCTGSFGTLLSGPLCPITDDMTYWEKLDALGGDSYDYDEEVDSQPGSFDYDDPRDYDKWYDWNDVDVEEGYYDPFQPNVEGRFVSLGMDTGYCSCCFGCV